MSHPAEEPIHWYALSAPYCKELDAQLRLQKAGIENFLPMQYRIVTDRTGKKSRQLVPAVHNLLFARSTRSQLQEVKEGYRYLQYRTRPEGARNVPIIVPDVQMQQFITVCNTHNEQLLFFRPEEINLRKGTKVRIHGGPFDGLEGIFVKVTGARSKRIVIMIDGLAAVAMTQVTPDLIEVI